MISLGRSSKPGRGGLGAVWAALAVLILVLASCGTPAPDRSLEQVQEAGVLRVALDASFPPLESVAKDGSLTGIDPDVARAIARRLGLQVRFDNMSSDGLKNALLADKADAVISSFIPVREWSREISYSQAYYDAGPVLAVTASDGSAGAIGVEAGGDGEKPARQRWPDRILTFETSEAALQALAAGRIQAAVVDVPDLRLFRAAAPAAHAAGPVLTSVPYVVAVRFGRNALLQRINEALDAMRSSGELAAITG